MSPRNRIHISSRDSIHSSESTVAMTPDDVNLDDDISLLSEHPFSQSAECPEIGFVEKGERSSLKEKDYCPSKGSLFSPEREKPATLVGGFPIRDVSVSHHGSPTLSNIATHRLSSTTGYLSPVSDGHMSPSNDGLLSLLSGHCGLPSDGHRSLSSDGHCSLPSDGHCSLSNSGILSGSAESPINSHIGDLGSSNDSPDGAPICSSTSFSAEQEQCPAGLESPTRDLSLVTHALPIRQRSVVLTMESKTGQKVYKLAQNGSELSSFYQRRDQDPREAVEMVCQIVLSAFPGYPDRPLPFTATLEDLKNGQLTTVVTTFIARARLFVCVCSFVCAF